MEKCTLKAQTALLQKMVRLNLKTIQDKILETLMKRSFFEEPKAKTMLEDFYSGIRCEEILTGF